MQIEIQFSLFIFPSFREGFLEGHVLKLSRGFRFIFSGNLNVFPHFEIFSNAALRDSQDKRI